MNQARQPIVTVAGHVDHGKTSILDSIRGTKIQEGEAGGITQKISFTTLPQETIQERSGETLAQFKIPLDIPGLLFIDTPGHAAFTNLRKRGGSLADIAIVVIDINDGIKPQTAEVLQILKANKTPFIIALNKIDNVSGWKTSDSKKTIDALQNQASNTKQLFDERFYTIIGALHSFGFDAELYSEITDFTKKIAAVPCSAKTGEGMSELIAMLCALSQKFLTERIQRGEKGKGVILEVKKEKDMNFVEAILYDGTLSLEDEIAIAHFEGLVTTKIRTMARALPLNKGFVTVQKVQAAAGLKLQVVEKEEILSGMPFQVIQNNQEEIKEEFDKEIKEEIKTDKKGIIAKAESLGSLEALLTLLKQSNIAVLKAGIGPITKKDLYSANAIEEPLEKMILGFNVELNDDAKDLEELQEVTVLTENVVYKLIENTQKWKTEKAKEIEKKKLDSLPKIAKITVLDFVFRNTNPAVFGVRVEGGTLKRGERFINTQDKKIGQIKEIQENKDTVKEAKKGSEVAISVPGLNVERQLTTGETLVTNLSETQFREFKKNKDLLTSDEKEVLSTIAQIKRRDNVAWGI